MIGATDEEGGFPTANEYHTEHVVATIYHKLGLPLDLTVTASDGRPVRLIEGEADPRVDLTRVANGEMTITRRSTYGRSLSFGFLRWP